MKKNPKTESSTLFLKHYKKSRANTHFFESSKERKTSKDKKRKKEKKINFSRKKIKTFNSEKMRKLNLRSLRVPKIPPKSLRPLMYFKDTKKKRIHSKKLDKKKNNRERKTLDSKNNLEKTEIKTKNHMKYLKKIVLRKPIKQFSFQKRDEESILIKNELKDKIKIKSKSKFTKFFKNFKSTKPKNKRRKVTNIDRSISFIKKNTKSASIKKYQRFSNMKDSKKSLLKFCRKNEKISFTENKRSLSKKLLKKKKETNYTLNLNKLILLDNLFNSIVFWEFENPPDFEILRNYLVFNNSFILNDLNNLFTHSEIRQNLRKYYLKEVLIFTYTIIFLILIIKKNIFVKNYTSRGSEEDKEYCEKYLENLNKDICELLVFIINHLHIVFVLRAEIFLDRAATFYKKDKTFKKIRILLSKRKLSYNIYINSKKHYKEHIKKMDNYLNLAEEALNEIFDLSSSFTNLAEFFAKNINQIKHRKNKAIKLKEYNKFLEFFSISIGKQGIEIFDKDNMEYLFEEKIIKSEIEENHTPNPAIPYLSFPKPSEKKLTLVLDLDETLIHFPDDKMDNFEEEINYSLKIRPFASELLEKLHPHYELIIYTAANQDYADMIIDKFDKKKLISHRLYRQHLTLHNDRLIKDLSKLGRDLDKIIILDDTPENFILQKRNGIYLKPWRGEKSDKCLLWISSVFLNFVVLDCKDIRDVLEEFKQMLSSI